MKIKEIVIFSNGANKETAELILFKVKNDLSFREKNILSTLTEIQKNHDVPSDYEIYRFFDKNGEGFEAGKTPSGYSITM